MFFALANWGTSDITRFSHYLAIDPHEVLDEPLWIAAAPLISALPYRLASIHGLVAGGFALVAARVLQRPQWAESGLVLWSPLLRNFLQNGVTRQALATVLITPLLIRVAGWWPNRLGLGDCRDRRLSPVPQQPAHHHTLALVPALTRPGLAEEHRLANHITLASCLVLLSVGIAFSQPAVLEKVNNYLFEAQYFNTYGLRKAVFGVELAALIAVLLTLWRARLSLKWRVISCPHPLRLLRAAGLGAALDGHRRDGADPRSLPGPDRPVLAVVLDGVDDASGMCLDPDSSVALYR